MPFNNINGKVVPFFGGGQCDQPCNCLIRSANPPSTSSGEPVSTIWINRLAGTTFMLVAKSSTTDTWSVLGGTAGAVNTVNGLVPVGGNITLAGTAGQVSVANAGNTVTLSVPAAFVAPGSIQATTTLSAASISTTGAIAAGTTLSAASASTTGAISAGTSLSAATTVTAGTGITSTAGNITATAGSVVVSAVGQGHTWPASAITGASPQANNARAGVVTFTGVSIAAGATQTFVINNSTITGAATRIMYNMSGATSGSALTMQSITQAAGTSTIVIENGNGAATSVANLVFDFIVMN